MRSLLLAALVLMPLRELQAASPSPSPAPSVAPSTAPSAASSAAPSAAPSAAEHGLGPSDSLHFVKLYMAKDKAGKPGDPSETFDVTDHKLYAVGKLNHYGPGAAVRLVWAIVQPGGAHEKIHELQYTLKPKDDQVTANIENPDNWAPGQYRLFAFLNGKPEPVVSFTIK